MFRLPLTVLLLALSCAVHGFDVNECILQGMKGVNSDAAARGVYLACQQKLTALERERQEAFAKESGEAVAPSIVTLDQHFVERPGFNSMAAMNRSADKVVTYIRISVTTSENGKCDGLMQYMAPDYAYQVIIPPGETVRLVYPAGDCIDVELVYARPRKWADRFHSVVEKVQPLPGDPLAGLH